MINEEAWADWLCEIGVLAPQSVWQTVWLIAHTHRCLFALIVCRSDVDDSIWQAFGFDFYGLEHTFVVD